MLRGLILSAVTAAAVIGAAITATGPAVADETLVLTWDDLIPDVAPLADPLSEQPMSVRYDLGFIAKVLIDAEHNLISRTGPEYLNALALADRLRKQGVAVDRLTTAVAGRDAEITRRGTELNKKLDGQTVRMPGYALPLETTEDGVTEFLLVPYVGACIHVPPPPPNQIVHAQLSTAFRLDGLYQPVWITGELIAGTRNRRLSFVDGQADVPTGYTMRVTKVEPYKE